MRILTVILLIAFISIGTVLIIISYYPILRDCFFKNRLKQDKMNVEQGLSILRSSHTPENKKSNYDDEIQNIRFKKSLTPEMVKRLNALEGKYVYRQ